MRNLFFRKQEQFVGLLQEFIQETNLAKDNFRYAMELYFTTGKCCPDFDFLVAQTHEAEAKSDDVKAKIERMLFEKTLIPDFRADIMEILDHIDDVPDQFDRVLYAIQTQNISVPHELIPDFRQLVTVSIEACDLMHRCVECLFHADREKDVADLHGSIDRCENQGDFIERRTIMRIFASDMSPLDKILLKDLIMLVGDIADFVKEVGRLINILTIKRRV